MIHKKQSKVTVQNIKAANNSFKNKKTEVENDLDIDFYLCILHIT